jgi:hypothetical protein
VRDNSAFRGWVEERRREGAAAALGIIGMGEAIMLRTCGHEAYITDREQPCDECWWSTREPGAWEKLLDSRHQCGAAVAFGLMGMAEAIRETDTIRRMVAFAENLPGCDCDDGTGPDEPADRGFICPHDPRGIAADEGESILDGSVLEAFE